MVGDQLACALTERRALGVTSHQRRNGFRKMQARAQHLFGDRRVGLGRPELRIAFAQTFNTAG
ncbi:Uncharacterised protein [Mycobacteroides abscessus subsp. massiliense]|nr:Uncharacterised protein [Mycobacteroides abscessus subsp. massiliense]